MRSLNTLDDTKPERVLSGVRQAVDDSIDQAEQFEDLTMLCLRYKGGK